MLIMIFILVTEFTGLLRVETSQPIGGYADPVVHYKFNVNFKFHFLILSFEENYDTLNDDIILRCFPGTREYYKPIKAKLTVTQ